MTADRLLMFLRDELYVDVGDIVASTPLFSSARIDSFAMVDLIAFLEQEADFRMDPADITLDNLDSVDRIVGFVNARG